jgi:hypothetical protein
VQRNECENALRPVRHDGHEHRETADDNAADDEKCATPIGVDIKGKDRGGPLWHAPQVTRSGPKTNSLLQFGDGRSKRIVEDHHLPR